MKLGHVGMDSLQVLAKYELLKGATSCNLKFDERCVLEKRTKVKQEVFLLYSH